MQRYTEKQYRRHSVLLMSLYVVFMFLEWPYARGAASLPLKIVLALVPTLPVIVLLWLMAKRVMSSDELQQRLHLMALSIATGVVAALSMLGGFLAAAGAIHLDGDILIWVFPALCMSYGIASMVFRKRYGGMGCE